MTEYLQQIVDAVFSWRGLATCVALGLLYWVPWGRIWKRDDGS